MAKELAEQGTSDIVAYEGMEEFAAVGFSEVTTEDLAIPFFRILQNNSPQKNKRDGAYVDGAEEGMFYNTVLNKVYNGEEGISLIPCYYNRRFVEWIPDNGGYVGEHETTSTVVAQSFKKEGDNKDWLENGNYLENTANFFCLVLDSELGPQRVQLPMSSTQLKKARKWLTQAQSLTAKGVNGTFVLPMMSQVYTAKSVTESNDYGQWFGWDINRQRGLDLSKAEDKELFDMALTFAKQVKAGEVQAKDDSAQASVEGDIIEQDDGVM